MKSNPKYKKGEMGFEQMAIGIGALAITVAMILVILTQVAVTQNVGWAYVNATNSSQGTVEIANDTVQAGITALALYGNFFSIVVILGIFVGIIGLLYMVTRGTGGQGGT